MGVVEGQVNLDDLLTVTANGIVRMKNPQAIVPLTVPPTAAQSFPLLDYLDQVQSKRTGVSDAQQGLNPDILQNTTATAVVAMQSAAAGKIEMIARVFAETGVKDLFEKILQLLCKYQDKARVIRLRGKYVSINPREWVNGFDISINVGLGTGNRQEQMVMISMVLAKQEEILKTIGVNNPLVDLGQYRNTLGRFIESAGFKDSSEFFKEITPEQLQMIAQPQEQQLPPDLQAAQVYAQVEQMKVEAKMQSDMAKTQIEEAKLQASREKAMADMAIQQSKIELDREKSMVQLQLQQAQIVVDAANQRNELALKERQQLIDELEKTQQVLQERQSQGNMADAVTNLGQMISQLQNNQANLAQAINTPKTLVRDENGKIVGIKAGE
jgi:hypothetical protein